MSSAQATSIQTPHMRGVFAHVLAFAAYFVSACFCLYIFFGYHTSPALIWLPLGIAIAAVVTALAYTAEAAVTLWALRQVKFTPDISTLRNTLILVGSAFILTVIAPA